MELCSGRIGLEPHHFTGSTPTDFFPKEQTEETPSPTLLRAVHLEAGFLGLGRGEELVCGGVGEGCLNKYNGHFHLISPFLYGSSSYP